MGAFRAGKADVLVATDVASRGIDISQVAMVVNYDVPEDPLLYFHRVGRTARAGRGGKAFSFVTRDDSGDFAKILQMTKAKISPLRDEDRVLPGHVKHHAYRRSGHGRFQGKRSGGRPNYRRWRR
jgi:ATP-dependent RNA helicase DeaD